MNGVLTLHWNCVKGSRKDYIKIGIPLFEASITGDWGTATKILEKRKELVRYSITENGETALHVAASAKSTKQVEDFVENLMGYMEDKDLELENNSSSTALCLAAEAGNVKIVKIMVKRNRNLVSITGSQGMTPLCRAALFGNYDVVKYLYKESQKMHYDYWTPQKPGWLLLKCVENDMFDIALKIVKDHPEVLGSSGSVLGVLACKTDAFAETKLNIFMRTINWVFTVICPKIGAEKESEASQLLRVIWQNIAEKPVNEIDDILRGPPDFINEKLASDKEDQTVETQNINKEPAATTLKDPNAPWQRNEDRTYSSRIPFVAAEMGNTTLVVELIRQYPDLMLKVNDNNQSIFHTAVENRHEDIYNILYEIGSKKDRILGLKDKNDNNMLHLVGKCAKKKRLGDVSGFAAPFQLQGELLWFKEVEEMVPPSCREQRNKDGLTPHELFTMEHNDLATKSGDWLKGMSSNCLVVAVFIASVTFAALLTVPGGYNQNDGLPIFSRKIAFMIFFLADAISFFSASGSVIMLLAILASCYAEHDFCKSLPKKLMTGLATLLLAITTMMVAFSSIFFILCNKDHKWMPVLASLLSIMLILLFATLQYPLLKDVISSTYGSRYLFRPKKRVLYENNCRFPFAFRYFSRCTSKILKLL
uniref:PGG domain-containing protein n=1 Tax=Lactuca sativa TaxID=4236 RepID=A0A9R1XS47_LACSA|nr:hypothetical protein LSAT_V11C200075680 [Lactuca sativa]